MLPTGKDGDLICPVCSQLVDTGWWDRALYGLTEAVPRHGVADSDVSDRSDTHGAPSSCAG